MRTSWEARYIYYTQQDTGYIKNKHEYSTWGNNTKAPTYNYDPEYRSTEPCYTGHPYDGSLNIYYAEARFYDAETGSWLSKDPAGASGGLNLYQYCRSNPTSYVDQTGEDPVVIEKAVEFIIAVVIVVVVVYETVVNNPDVRNAAEDFWNALTRPSAGYFSPINCIEEKGGKSEQQIQEGEEDKIKDDAESLEDILKDAKPGRSTKGKTQQWEKEGGYEEAINDYDRLDPQNSRDIETQYGPGKTGELQDGSKINVRPGSSYGDPTVEIQKPNGVRIKIRYGE